MILCRLALVLLLAQGIALALARGLDLRLPRKIQVMGTVLPILVLLPWLWSGRLLAPCDMPILNNIPDAPHVADPDVHGAFNDAIFQLLPWEVEARRALGDLRLPLWSDVLDGGSSPWINPQAAVLSPVAMLARVLPLAHFLLGALAVKILFAFEGVWLLARFLGISRRSSMLAGLGFALGGPITAWAVFPLSSVIAWSPWLVLAVGRLVRCNTIRHIVVASLIGAAVLLGGHPEVALGAAFVAGLIGLLILRRGTGRVRPLAGVAAAGVLATCLAACQVLPILLAAPHALRANHSAAGVGEDRFPEPVQRSLFLPRQGELFLSPLSPWAFGRPFHERYSGLGSWPSGAGGYIGLVLLAALPPAVLSRRSRLALYLSGVGLVVYLLAAGFYPFHRVLSSLPLMRAVAVDRFLPLAALAFALAGGLGLDALLRERRRLGWLGFAVAATASLAVRHDLPLVLLWLGFAGAIFAGQRWSRGAGFAVLAALSFVELLAWDLDSLPSGHRELFYPRTPLIAAIESGVRRDGEGGGGPWRAVGDGYAVYPSLLPFYEIAEVRIDNPFALSSQLRPLAEIFQFQPEGRRYKSAFHHIDHPFLSFLNTRIVVTEREAVAGFELIRAQPPLNVFRNPRALPRWFLPVSAESTPRADALRRLAALQDARHVLLYEEEVAGWTPPARPWNPDAVKVVRSSPGWLLLRLPAEGEKLLATSLPFPEGWRVTADGKPLRRLTVNTAYLGAVVPSGSELINLDFAPPGFGAGMGLTAAAVALLVALATAGFLRRAHGAGGRGSAGRARKWVRRAATLSVAPAGGAVPEGR
jgi:hypothetical protein